MTTRRTALKAMVAAPVAIVAGQPAATVAHVHADTRNDSQDPYHGAAIVGLEGLLSALERYQDARATWDDAALDARALAHVVATARDFLDGDMVGSDSHRRRCASARRRYHGHKVANALCLASLDALDNLYDLVALHGCADPWHCPVCDLADIVARVIDQHFPLVRGDLKGNDLLQVEGRVIQSAKRRVARARQAAARGRELLPATAQDHDDADVALVAAQERLALMKLTAQRKENAQ